MVYDLPNVQTAEITLIGTGGGYGESCVIHYGLNKWAVIDSCINPASGMSLPLEYLKKIGVKVDTDVKFVLCTHWHRDHIQGLSQLLDECKLADLYFARSNDRRKFLAWVSLDYQKVTEEGTTSSTDEFVDCMKIAESRGTRVIQVSPDRVLENIPKIGVSITALSPSDYVLQQYDGEIAQLITEYGVVPDRCYVHQSPNDKSVVLLLEVGNHKAILGADLEVSPDNRKGWLNILDYSKVIANKKAKLFKISHHGSRNGYDDRIWVDLLENNPISKLTPYNRCGNLPELEMVKLYSEKTDKLFITAPIINASKPIKRDNSFNKIIQLFNVKVSEVKYSLGLIRSRVNIADNAASWTVDLDGESFKIEA